jgi:hypothetical protein
MLRVASPGQGLPPYKLGLLLGKAANRAIAQGDFLFDGDLGDKESRHHHYSFPIKWGVPVRYHDFVHYKEWINPDLFEFHLSYRDLSANPDSFLSSVDCTRLVVHAPELFENSELLDLVSDNPEYRKRSILNMQRVVDATHEIAKFFQSVRKDVKLLLDFGHLKVSSNTLGFDLSSAVSRIQPWVGGYHLSENHGELDDHLNFDANAWFFPYLDPRVDFATLEIKNSRPEDIYKTWKMTHEKVNDTLN